jgi:hypothetical protein
VEGESAAAVARCRSDQSALNPANRNKYRLKENAATGEKSCSRKIHEQGQEIGNSRGAHWI